MIDRSSRSPPTRSQPMVIACGRGRALLVANTNISLTQLSLVYTERSSRRTLAPPLAFADVSSDAQLTPDAPPTAECSDDQSTLLFDVSVTCRTSLGHRPLCRCARDDVSSRRKHGKGSEQRELTTLCNLHCRFAVVVQDCSRMGTGQNGDNSKTATIKTATHP